MVGICHNYAAGLCFCCIGHWCHAAHNQNETTTHEVQFFQIENTDTQTHSGTETATDSNLAKTIPVLAAAFAKADCPPDAGAEAFVPAAALANADCPATPAAAFANADCATPDAAFANADCAPPDAGDAFENADPKPDGLDPVPLLGPNDFVPNSGAAFSFVPNSGAAFSFNAEPKPAGGELTVRLLASGFALFAGGSLSSLVTCSCKRDRETERDRERQRERETEWLVERMQRCAREQAIPEDGSGSKALLYARRVVAKTTAKTTTGRAHLRGSFPARLCYFLDFLCCSLARGRGRHRGLRCLHTHARAHTHTKTRTPTDQAVNSFGNLTGYTNWDPFSVH